MNDAERYKEIVGATPEVGSDGWFVGAPQEMRAHSRLARYITKEWIYKNAVPDKADELLAFDPEALRETMEAYERAGGLATGGIEGGTVFETWAANQIFLKKRHSVLLSDAASNLPIDDVTRVYLLSPSQLVDVLEDLLPVSEKGKSDSESELYALMNTGQVGHVIRLRSRSNNLDEIYYWDTWPGPSLLCEGNNSAGARAQLVQTEPVRWGLTRGEFEKVACALVVPTQSLAWSDYGESLCSYAKLKETDVFGYFRLREAASFPANNVLTVQPCLTRVEGSEVAVDFFLDSNHFVRSARVGIALKDLARNSVHIADLLMHMFRQLDAEASSHPNRPELRALIIQAASTNRPTARVGATVSATMGVLSEETGPRFVAELLPA